MKIAYTFGTGRGDTDLLLHQVAKALMEAGLRPAGTVQINTEREDSGPCDMDVLVLPKGPIIRISQDLGRNSRGCRLDPSALEQAVGLVTGHLETGDCLIVNKFGKHEAQGHGFRPLIAEALMREMPVLVGLNGLNAPAFDEFTAGMAVKLEPDSKILLTWLLDALNVHPSATILEAKIA